jgi:cation transport regulator
MPYNSVNELPENVRLVLPKHAQDIYKEAFNSAYEQYKNPKDRKDGADREEVSHKVAWSAVKKTYKKGNDGTWHKREG